MADIVSSSKRSSMMSGIRSKNTQPELRIRKALYKAGYRYRLHDKKLPGKPDLKLQKYNAVVFVNGCFWHAHDCHLFRIPSTRKEFWKEKLEKNRKNDEANISRLIDLNWRVCIIWECSIRGRLRLPFEEVIDGVIEWLNSGECYLELRGRDSIKE